MVREQVSRTGQPDHASAYCAYAPDANCMLTVLCRYRHPPNEACRAYAAGLAWLLCACALCACVIKLYALHAVSRCRRCAARFPLLWIYGKPRGWLLESHCATLAASRLRSFPCWCIDGYLGRLCDLPRPQGALHDRHLRRDLNLGEPMGNRRIEIGTMAALAATTAVHTPLHFWVLFAHVTIWSLFGQYALVFYPFLMPSGSFDAYTVSCDHVNKRFRRYTPFVCSDSVLKVVCFGVCSGVSGHI